MGRLIVAEEKAASTGPNKVVAGGALAALRFSVLIPLESHRGYAVRCVRGWAEEQVFPRDQFEIVLACPPGCPPAQLDEIRRMLGPQDQVLQVDHDHDMGLCFEAAKAARGDILFFTESHCLPEPRTLALADAAARLNPEWAGFSCRSVPITRNLLSRVEAESYGREIEFGVNEHSWRKVLDQCFVVRRAAYFQAGGFDPAYGHFAEWLLAARFHALGLQIGYTPDARIHHLYIGQFGEWRRFTADFIEGQMKYLALQPPDPLRAMFDEVPEWSRRHNLQRQPARRICRMLLLDLRGLIVAAPKTGRRTALWRWHWRLLAAWLGRAVAGHSVVLIRAQWQRFSARVGLQIDLLRRNQAGAEKRLARCCEAIATAQRTKFLRDSARELRLDADRGESLGDGPVGAGTWKPGLLRESHGVGFHMASGAGAEVIRWSEPAAYVELPLTPGGYEVTLNWLFRPPVHGLPQPRFYLNECRLAAESVRTFPDRVEFDVDIPESSSPARLGWVCSEFHAPGDDRALGLPVVSITWLSRPDPSGSDPSVSAP